MPPLEAQRRINGRKAPGNRDENDITLDEVSSPSVDAQQRHKVDVIGLLAARGSFTSEARSLTPILRFLDACAAAISSESAKTADALPSAQDVRDSSTLHAQELASLTEIIATWPFRAKRVQPIVS